MHPDVKQLVQTSRFHECFGCLKFTGLTICN